MSDTACTKAEGIGSQGLVGSRFSFCQRPHKGAGRASKVVQIRDRADHGQKDAVRLMASRARREFKCGCGCHKAVCHRSGKRTRHERVTAIATSDSSVGSQAEGATPDAGGAPFSLRTEDWSPSVPVERGGSQLSAPVLTDRADDHDVLSAHHLPSPHAGRLT